MVKKLDDWLYMAVIWFSRAAQRLDAWFTYRRMMRRCGKN
jgi:hypothetical protein